MNKKQQEDYNSTFRRFMEDSQNIFDTSEMTDILNKLHRYETSLHTIAEIWCQENISDSEIKRIEKRETSIENKVKEIAEHLGFKVKFQNDPRGMSIRFILPSGYYNSWDGETWVIDW